MCLFNYIVIYLNTPNTFRLFISFIRIPYKGTLTEFKNKILVQFGLTVRLKCQDREILENIILPYVNHKSQYEKVIFIGIQYYTKFYTKILRNKDLYYIEIDKKNAIYGNKKTIIDSCINIDKYFDEETVDVIICNGFWGYGLNDQESTEKTFQRIFKILKKEGLFIFSYNIYRYPYNILQTEIFKLFKPYFFEPLKGEKFICEKNFWKHTFLFYTK